MQPDREELTLSTSTMTKESDLEDFELSTELFQEPVDFRLPPPKPTTDVFVRDVEIVQENTPSVLEIQLVGKHSLWA